MKRIWFAAANLLMLALVGCGGGGNPTPSTMSVPTGSIEGRLVTENSVPSKSRQANIRFRARVHGLETQNNFSLQISANGEFRIDNVPAGEQVISVEDQTSRKGAVFVCLVRPGQVTNIGEIELTNLASISGTVTDTSDKPITRARIVAFPINDENDTIEQLPARPFFTALTDKNGEYELLVPAGTYFVETRHPDYEPASQMVTVEESSIVTLDFQLTPRPRKTGTVAGTVMAELNGNVVPVPGALILLKPQSEIIVPLALAKNATEEDNATEEEIAITATEETTVGQLISTQMNPSLPGLVPPGHPIRYRLFTFTKADGSFELTGVPAGTYTAIAYKPNYGRDTRNVTVGANETVKVEFVLRANLGIISGQVTDALTGQPIEKALVFAVRWNDIGFGWEDWEQGEDGHWVRPMGSGGHKKGHRPIHRPVKPPIFEPPIRAGTLTDANGNYNIVLPSGDYFVIAVKEGYLAVGQPVSVLSGQTLTVNFALQPGMWVQ